MLYLRRLIALALACVAAFAFGACNVIDGGDLDTLTEAIDSVSQGDKNKLNHNVRIQKTQEYLDSFDDSTEIGRMRCIGDPKFPLQHHSDDDWFDLFDADGAWKDPTVGQIRDCMKNGFTQTFPLQPDKVVKLVPGEVTYPQCWSAIISTATDKAEAELIRRSKSDNPFEYWTDNFRNLKGIQKFKCVPDRYDAFDPGYIFYGDDVPQIPDMSEIEVSNPKPPRDPLGLPDLEEDEYGGWVQDLDGKLTRTRILVQMIFGLHKMPPILATPVFVDALEESVIVICAGLAPLDTKESWGCASAPGLPGYTPTPSDSSSGGDQ